jgi:predicted transposase YbfD/YdcC
VTGEVIALAGTTRRGSFDTAAGQSPRQLVSAWATTARLVLGPVAVDAPSNASTAIPLLLELLDLRGGIVTSDALGCPQEIVATIRACEADDVLAVKDNQPPLPQTIAEACIAHAEADFRDPALRRCKTVERGHGREETRAYVVAAVPAALRERAAWQDVRSIGRGMRTRVQAGADRDAIVYDLSSLPPKVKAFARAVRGPWGVENQLHWSLDVVLAEDQCRVRRGHGPANLGMLRRLALSMLQQDTSSKDRVRGKRLAAGWNDEVLWKLLTSFSGK